MEADSTYFIGYGRLEDLIAVHKDPAQPFYVELLTCRFPGEPIAWAELLVLVQDFDEAARVRYCRISCGGYDLIHGTPFDREQARKIHAEAMRRLDVILNSLRDQGFKLERASVAFPRDLLLLNGDADLLHSEGDNRREQGQWNCQAPPSGGEKVSL